MELCDFILFNIDDEVRRLELYIGDITKLELKDSVDLLLISAKRNSYYPAPHSLIEAIKNNLNINLESLSKDKEEDLRLIFNCWISKELSSDIPFKRILCLEQSKESSKSHEDQSYIIGDMFKALFTTYRGEEWSLITPLLATGYQQSNKQQMINEMIRTAVAWILAGMPLKCMKIVIYTKKGCKYLDSEDIDAINEFKTLKSEINWKPNLKKLLTIQRNALLLYVKEDEDRVNLFFSSLKRIRKENIVIEIKCLVQEQSIDSSTESIVSEYIQEMVLSSQKVGIFLTNHYLKNSDAVTIYNLVLCLSQHLPKPLLTTICLTKVDGIPEYMKLNQWINCRINGEIELQDRIEKGASDFYEIIENDYVVPNNLPNPIYNEFSQIRTDSSYDLFISYSHQDRTIAHKIFTFLELSLPNKRIFYDIKDIHTGCSWQNKIYTALSNCQVVLALLSENYFQSSMCHEEFNIAVSQHWSPDFHTVLIPLWISNQTLESTWTNHKIKIFKSFLLNNVFVPTICKCEKNLFSNDIQLNTIIYYLLKNIISPIIYGGVVPIYFPERTMITLEDAACKARETFFELNWNMWKNLNMFKNEEKEILKTKNQNTFPYDVTIGFHKDDLYYAEYLKLSLLELNKDVKVSFTPVGYDTNAWMNKNFESANFIIILLKPYYALTKSCQYQLHTALSLQRNKNKHLVIPIILESLPQSPSYIHLLSSRFKASDKIYLVYQKLLYKKGILDILNITKFTNIPLRVRIMLNFASLWIINQGSSLKKFLPSESLPLIYSTYDLINTDFRTPQYLDEFITENQVKFITILKENMETVQNLLDKNTENSKS